MSKEIVKRLGYYAKDENGNLFQYQWGADETFSIWIDGEWVVEDANRYIVLEIGYFRSGE